MFWQANANSQTEDSSRKRTADQISNNDDEENTSCTSSTHSDDKASNASTDSDRIMFNSKKKRRSSKTRSRHKKSSSSSKTTDLASWARQVHGDSLKIKDRSVQLVKDFDIRTKSFMEFVGNWDMSRKEAETGYSEAHLNMVQAVEEFSEKAQQTAEMAHDLIKTVDLKLVKFSNKLDQILELQKVHNESVEELKTNQQAMLEMMQQQQQQQQGRLNDNTLIESDHYSLPDTKVYLAERPYKRTLLSDDAPSDVKEDVYEFI